MDDLTLLYISASRMPNKWIEFQTKKLIDVVGNTPYWGKAKDIIKIYTEGIK